MKFEEGTLKILKKNGKNFIYAVTTLPSINSSGDHEESIELFELPERDKEAEQKAQALFSSLKKKGCVICCSEGLNDNCEIKKEFGLK
jgi:hypothetical protein